MYQLEPKPDCVKEQLTLQYDASTQPKPAFRDPAFMENRTAPVHRWVPWIAGFSANFVHDCIASYLSAKGTVLDPFAGVGTTLVSAVMEGHDAVGFDINPYAVLACECKLAAIDLDPEDLNQQIGAYIAATKQKHTANTGETPPEFHTRIPFFSPRILSQVFRFQELVAELNDPQIKNFFRLAFGSVMVSFSNYTYEPSLSTRPGAGKALIEDADVHGVIVAKLKEMARDLQWLRNRIDTKTGSGRIYSKSFLTASEVLHPASVDLAITSPPYLNNYHYLRSTRPQLHWLELVSGRPDLRALEENNIGKYWQTVRTAKPVELEFEYSQLESLLCSIRSTRAEKGPYGGPGWSNYAASYFNDSYAFLQELSKALKPGGVAVIVVGNSIIQGHEIRVDDVLSYIGRGFGLETDRIEMLRTKRIGASITKSTVRRGETSQAALYESAIILKKV